MAFEGLSEKLNNVFKKLRSRGKLSENDVKEAMREVRLALLEADVSYKVVKDFVAKVTERAVGEDVLASLTPAQMVIKIVNEELCSLMGNSNARINLASKPPTVIMMCGLQGSGKTTHAAKERKEEMGFKNRRGGGGGVVFGVRGKIPTPLNLQNSLKKKVTDLCLLPAIFTGLLL